MPFFTLLNLYWLIQAHAVSMVFNCLIQHAVALYKDATKEGNLFSINGVQQELSVMRLKGTFLEA